MFGGEGRCVHVCVSVSVSVQTSFKLLLKLAGHFPMRFIELITRKLSDAQPEKSNHQSVHVHYDFICFYYFYSAAKNNKLSKTLIGTSVSDGFFTLRTIIIVIILYYSYWPVCRWRTNWLLLREMSFWLYSLLLRIHLWSTFVGVLLSSDHPLDMLNYKIYFKLVRLVPLIIFVEA